MSKTAWKAIGIVALIVLLAVTIVCIVAGVKAGNEDIGFFDALGQLFGIGTAEPEVIEPGEEIVEAIKNIA